MNTMDTITDRIRKLYPVSLALSILMAACGVAVLFFPPTSLVALEWILMIGFVLLGVFRIVVYAKLPYMVRQGYMLVSGVFEVLCGAMMIVAMIRSPEITSETLAVMIGYMVGFYALFSGIDMLCGCGFIRKIGGSTGWMIFSGILEILAGALLLAVPTFGTLWFMVAVGVCLVMDGVGLFISLIDLKNRVKALKNYQGRGGAAFDPAEDSYVIWKND